MILVFVVNYERRSSPSAHAVSGGLGCTGEDAAAQDDGRSDSDARVDYRRTGVRLGPSSVKVAGWCRRITSRVALTCRRAHPWATRIFRSLPFPVAAFLLGRKQTYAGVTAACAIRAMTQTNAAISRAIATTMTFCGLPVFCRRR